MMKIFPFASRSLLLLLTLGGACATGQPSADPEPVLEDPSVTVPPNQAQLDSEGAEATEPFPYCQGRTAPNGAEAAYCRFLCPSSHQAQAPSAALLPPGVAPPSAPPPPQPGCIPCRQGEEVPVDERDVPLGFTGGPAVPFGSFAGTIPGQCCEHAMRAYVYDEATDSWAYRPELLADESAHDKCEFYLRARECLPGCENCERKRLERYYRTCEGNTFLAQAGFRPQDVPASFADTNRAQYLTCAQNPLFVQYADGMRWCLQAYASAQYNQHPGQSYGAAGNADDPPRANGTPGDCKDCKTFVNGTPPANVNDGIIGSHNDCNRIQGFCQLAGDIGAAMPGGARTPPALQCFAAGMGYSWGAVLGEATPVGAMQSVGLCHMVTQASQCLPQMNGAQFAKFWTDLCTGYQDGCMSHTADVEAGMIATTQATTKHAASRALCVLSCPTPNDLRATVLSGHIAALTAAYIGGDFDPANPPASNGLPRLVWELARVAPLFQLIEYAASSAGLLANVVPNNPFAMQFFSATLESSCMSLQQAVAGALGAAGDLPRQPCLTWDDVGLPESECLE